MKQTFLMAILLLGMAFGCIGCKESNKIDEPNLWKSQTLLGTSPDESYSIWLGVDENDAPYLIKEKGGKEIQVTSAPTYSKAFFYPTGGSYELVAIPNFALFFDDTIAIIAYANHGTDGIYALNYYTPTLSKINSFQNAYYQQEFKFTRWGDKRIVLALSGITESSSHLFLLNEQGALVQEIQSDQRAYLPEEHIQKIVFDNLEYIAITNGAISRHDLFGNQLWLTSFKERYPNRPSTVTFYPTFTLLSYQEEATSLHIELQIDYYDKTNEVVSLSIDLNSGETN